MSDTNGGPMHLRRDWAGPMHLHDANLDGQPLPHVVESPEESRAGRSLQDSEKRYRRLFESAQDGILILDADSGKVVDANPFLLQLLGYSYDAMCGQFIWELGVFKDIAASKDAFKTLQENAYIRYDDLPLETLDGTGHRRGVRQQRLPRGPRAGSSSATSATSPSASARRGPWQRARPRRAASWTTSASAWPSSVRTMEVLEMNRRMREWFPDVDPAQRPFCYDAFNDPPRRRRCATAARRTRPSRTAWSTSSRRKRRGQGGRATTASCRLRSSTRRAR